MEELRFVTLDEGSPLPRPSSFPPSSSTVLPRSVRIGVLSWYRNFPTNVSSAPDFDGKSFEISLGYDRLNSSIFSLSNGFIARPFSRNTHTRARAREKKEANKLLEYGSVAS